LPLLEASHLLLAITTDQICVFDVSVGDEAGDEAIGTFDFAIGTLHIDNAR